MRARSDPTAGVLELPVFGDLGSNEQFAMAFRQALESLYERGAAATVAELR